MRQILQRIRFIASEAFSLLALVYVASRGVQYAKERCPVTSLRMRIHSILFLALQNVNIHRDTGSDVTCIFYMEARVVTIPRSTQ